MLGIARSRRAFDRGLQAACLSWAILTVTVLTPAGASATVAWRDTPNGSLSTTVHAMADDGTGAHVVAPVARGFELSPDGAWIAFEARAGVLVRATGPGAPAARMLRRGATIAATAWAPDGRTLALGFGRRVAIVDVHGKLQASFGVGGTRGSVGGIGFAPDGRRLAVTVHDLPRAEMHARLLVVSAHGRRLRERRLAQPHAFHPEWVGDEIDVEAGFFDQDTGWENATDLHEYRVPATLQGPLVAFADDRTAPRAQAVAAATVQAEALGVVAPWEAQVRG